MFFISIGHISCVINKGNDILDEAVAKSRPSTPTGFSGSSSGATEIYLVWNASTDNKSSADKIKYQICQSQSADGCASFQVNYTTAAGRTNYTASGLTTNTVYYFKVRSVNEIGIESDSSGTINATPLVSGSALWAKTITAGTDTSSFLEVSKNTLNEIFTVGYQVGTGNYTYPPGITVTGTSSFGNAILVKYNASGDAQWVRSTSAGSDNSYFEAIAFDSSNNIYVAGAQDGTGTYNYGNGVTVAGAHTGSNIVLVKYDSSGKAQWARSVTTGGSSSSYKSLVIDASNSLYVAGHQQGTGTYTFGAGVTSTGTNASARNAALVKYDSSGNAIWARTTSAGADKSQFSGVAKDSNGNIYTVGYQNGNGSYTYSAGVSVSGTHTGSNALFVKYNSSGTAQFAKSVSTGSGASIFRAIAIDSSGNIFIVGSQGGTGAYTYGASVSCSGSHTGKNVVLVKYNKNGDAQWCKTVTAGNGNSIYTSITVDSKGNIYTTGRQAGSGTYTYGAGVSINASHSGDNATVIKYNSEGNPQWAKTVTTGSANSYFRGVIIDRLNNIYTAGDQSGTSSFTYGTNTSISGTNGSGENASIVKYSP